LQLGFYTNGVSTRGFSYTIRVYGKRVLQLRVSTKKGLPYKLKGL
jgi:hypothetical protein